MWGGEQAFVDALVLQSFMDLPNLNKLLMVMFALCKRLCMLLQARPRHSLDPGG